MNKILSTLLAFSFILLSGCYTQLYVVDSVIVEQPAPPPPPPPQPEPCWNCYQPAPLYDPAPVITQPPPTHRDPGPQRIDDRTNDVPEKTRQNSPPRDEHHR